MATNQAPQIYLPQNYSLRRCCNPPQHLPPTICTPKRDCFEPSASGAVIPQSDPQNIREALRRQATPHSSPFPMMTNPSPPPSGIEPPPHPVLPPASPPRGTAPGAGTWRWRSRRSGPSSSGSWPGPTAYGCTTATPPLRSGFGAALSRCTCLNARIFGMSRLSL